MNCPNCGTIVATNADRCPKCAAMLPSDCSWLVCLLLDFFLGVIGAHRFYVGKIASGIGYLLTFGWLGIGPLIDFFVIICGKFKDSKGRIVSGRKDQNAVTFVMPAQSPVSSPATPAVSPAMAAPTPVAYAAPAAVNCQWTDALRKNNGRIMVQPREMTVSFQPVPQDLINKHIKKYAGKLGLQPNEEILFATGLATGGTFTSQGFIVSSSAIYCSVGKPTTILTSGLGGTKQERIPLEAIKSIGFVAEPDAYSSGSIAMNINGQEFGSLILPISAMSWLKYAADREAPCKQAAAFFNAIFA